MRLTRNVDLISTNSRVTHSLTPIQNESLIAARFVLMFPLFRKPNELSEFSAPS